MAARLTAKLVGEGYAKPNAENELPIDINYAKLSEWLVDRKQVPADYNRKLQAIQAKAAEAVRQLPPGFLGQFEGGDDVPLDYFLAQSVLAKLAETAEKGYFGSLKGAAGDWEKVVKAYEYNLICVAEAAQTLARNADFEIPFLKKQAAKAQQQLTDLERRKGEAHKSAAAAAAEFQQECQRLGVDSGNIRAGLLALTAELPELVGAAIEALQGEPLSQAVDYYAAVVEQQQQGQQGSAAAAEGALQVLLEVREGRTEPPAAPAAPAAAGDGGAAEEGGSGAGGEVDWDLGAALEAMDGGAEAEASGAGEAAGISWDLDAADMATAGGDAAGTAGAADAPAGISWDFQVESSGGAGDAPGGGVADVAPAGISWDIDISAEGEAEQRAAAASGASGTASAQAGGNGVAAAAAAAGDEPAAVRRLVQDAGYRAHLLDDLYELRAFLTQRCRELGSKSNELLMASGSDVVRQVSSDVAGAMLDGVNAALAQLNGDKLRQLVALRTSQRYLDRMAAGLHQKAGQEAKFHRAAADAELRRGEIQRQLMADSAKLAVLVKRTRQAKEGAEAALSAKLGRRINIMGEINQVI